MGPCVTQTGYELQHLRGTQDEQTARNLSLCNDPSVSTAYLQPPKHNGGDEVRIPQMIEPNGDDVLETSLLR